MSLKYEPASVVEEEANTCAMDVYYTASSLLVISMCSKLHNTRPFKFKPSFYKMFHKSESPKKRAVVNSCDVGYRVWVLANRVRSYFYFTALLKHI